MGAGTLMVWLVLQFIVVVTCEYLGNTTKGEIYGNEPLNRQHLDQAEVWTMVDAANPILYDGTVPSASFYASNTRPLKIGLYRPISGTILTLIAQVDVTPTAGNNEVTLCGFDAQEGDMMGFTWLNYGAIPYDNSRSYNYYEYNAQFDVGSKQAFETNRYGNRVYSFRYTLSAGRGIILGNDLTNRQHLDEAEVWTMVDAANPILYDGTVPSASFYARNTRPLKIGLYRPISGTILTVIAQVDVTPTAGNNEVTLCGFDAQEGDMMGFTWLNYGAIPYDNSRSYNYYEYNAQFNVGSKQAFETNRYGNRVYSFKYTLLPQTRAGITFGNDLTNRQHLDEAEVWTMVDAANPIIHDGTVSSVSFYARNTRPLKIGLYRPISGTIMELLAEEYVTPIVGINHILLDGFDTQEGDMMGFIWLDYGVIPFDDSQSYNYYEYPAEFSIGTYAELIAERYGNRAYSFEYTLV